MQVQRANASGQDVVNDIKENIETTISEDLAGGQTAKLDTSLKLLGEGDTLSSCSYLVMNSKTTRNVRIRHYTTPNRFLPPSLARLSNTAYAT